MLTFYFLDKDIMKKIRPNLDYGDQWSPYKINMQLDRIQGIATKMVPKLKDLFYDEKLKKWT